MKLLSEKQVVKKIDKKLSEMEGLLKSPKNIAPVEMPEKQTVIDKQTSLSRLKTLRLELHKYST